MRRNLTYKAMVLALAIFTTQSDGFAQEKAHRYTDIKEVDFKNFSFAPGLFDDSKVITTRNGEYSVEEPEEDRMYFKVVDVVYGDLTGDSVDEAVVTTLLNTGGTGQFSDALVYVLKDGKPEVVGSLGIGDRADGGIHDVRILGGRIVAERYGQEHSGACCPEYVETYLIRLNGSKLVEAGRPTRRAFARYDGEAGGPPQPIRFLRGSSGAILSGTSSGKERFLVGARGGQVVSVKMHSDDATARVKLVAPDGKIVTTVGHDKTWSGKLPLNGDYVMVIESDLPADDYSGWYSLEIEIN